MDEPPSKRARPSSPPSSSSSAPPAPAWTPPILTPANLPHPNLLLSGHASSVYSTFFSPSGTVLATASFDKTVLLWSLTGKFSSYNTLLGFKNAVTQCAFLEEGVLATGSADKCVRVHDTDEAKVRLKKEGGREKRKEGRSLRRVPRGGGRRVRGAKERRGGAHR